MEIGETDKNSLFKNSYFPSYEVDQKFATLGVE